MLELDTSIMLKIGVDVPVTLPKLVVVEAVKGVVEVTEVTDAPAEVLETDEMVAELLALEIEMGRVLSKLSRLEVDIVVEDSLELEVRLGKVLSVCGAIVEELSGLEVGMEIMVENPPRLEIPGMTKGFLALGVEMKETLEMLPRLEARLGKELTEPPRVGLGETVEKMWEVEVGTGRML